MNKRTKNTTGMTMPKEKRFKDQPFYCKGSGATCFLGPGSYNDHQAYISLRKASCPAKIVSVWYNLIDSNLDADQSFTEQGKWKVVLYNDRLTNKI